MEICDKDVYENEEKTFYLWFINAENWRTFLILLVQWAAVTV